MPDLEVAKSLAEQDLFLIELPGGEQTRYAVVEQFMIIDPGEAVMGVPWSELAALFKNRTLRAVPMPGRRTGVQLDGQLGQSTSPGPGFNPNNVEVNLLKIGKDN